MAGVSDWLKQTFMPGAGTPKSDALMALGASLLQASQPTTNPGGNSMGAALGQGAMAYQDTLRRSQRAQREEEEYQAKKQERETRQRAQSTLVGGFDPSTGVNWNTGRPGLSEEDRIGLVGQIDVGTGLKMQQDVAERNRTKQYIEQFVSSLPEAQQAQMAPLLQLEPKEGLKHILEIQRKQQFPDLPDYMWMDPETGQPAVIPQALDYHRQKAEAEAQMRAKYRAPRAPRTSYEVITGEAAAALGLDPTKRYNRASTGQVTPIKDDTGKSTGIRIGADGTVQIGGSPELDLTEQQGKANLANKVMTQSDTVFQELEEKGYDPNAFMEAVRWLPGNILGSIPWVGDSVERTLDNFFLSPEGQQYQQAQQAWTRAKVRLESGADIKDSEVEKDERTYFPGVFESPDTIDQKAAARERVKQGVNEMSGPAAAGTGQPITLSVEGVKSMTDDQINALIRRPDFDSTQLPGPLRDALQERLTRLLGD